MSRCVIVAASPSFDTALLRQTVRADDFVICADGGYLFAQKAGVKPSIIVGDFDSSHRPQTDVPVVLLPTHKDDTDTMSAIKEGIRRGYREFVLLGALGGREDHTFANYSALQYLYENGAHGVLLGKGLQVHYVPVGDFPVHNKEGCVLSVFPFGCAGCTVTHRGFEYELAGQEIASSFPLGVSNVVKSNRAVLTLHQGSALVMIYDKGGERQPL
ncbi:MAG: thiamine diphosphokinase [Acutalibacteraceae bacterium]|nr:thiamine diphosphokinase [Acutalibacteraceae bacterium]